MPKRKKYPKLPNGYGQIRFLGKGRRNPYGVYPPSVEEYDNGTKKTPPALCYVSDRMVGLAVLTSYHAGTYKPGDEIMIENQMHGNTVPAASDKFFERLLSDYNKKMFSIEDEESPTFSDIFKKFYLYKFGVEYGHEGKRKSMERSLSAAYNNVTEFHNRAFTDIKTDELQRVLNSVGERLSYSSAALVKTLYNQMYAYAVANDLCEKNYASFVKMQTEDDTEHGVPFSDQELKLLWDHKSNDIVEFLLIMCYSGFRISAYKTLEVNLDQKYFKGGIKTASGKDRTVPIHSAILPLVRQRIRKYGVLLPCTPEWFRDDMYAKLDSLGIERHPPHDCRHTFSRLCEQYAVKENDRKRMLGHSFGNDITNRVYGHRTLEDLRREIEKIQVP